MAQKSHGTCQSIGDFYAGRSVFITGATGFLGKAYVEKLAYQCTEINQIYILIRNIKGLNLEQRMQEYFDHPFFARLKQERPEAMSKIIPILGDITSPNLGLKAEDERTLIEKVSVVIHSAASIKFNQTLMDAIQVNVEGTRKVLHLAKRMNNTCVFVYVSTAYSNINEKVMEEKMYPPPASFEEAKKFATRHYILGDDDKQMTKFLKGYPNTYTFSKVLAENVVAEDRGHLAVVIVRPSIISASEREPVEGWIDNWCGATSIITFTAKGWIHALLARGDVILDMIPLDYAVNLTIVAAASIPKKPGLAVYHSCTSSTNPITVHELYNDIKVYNMKYNISDSPFNVSLVITEHQTVVSIVTCLMQTTPAFLADVWLRCKGKQPKYVKQQSKVTQVRESFHFFTARSWQMFGEGARNLHSSLNPEDQRAFPCDPSLIHWRQYILKYLAGIEKYLLKKN